MTTSPSCSGTQASLLGLGAAMWIRLSGPSGQVGAILLNMAVFGAVLAYVLQMASFILLRLKAPGMARPFTSRLGIPGALVAAGLAILTLGALFTNADYRIGVWGGRRYGSSAVWCTSPRTRAID